MLNLKVGDTFTARQGLQTAVFEVLAPIEGGFVCGGRSNCQPTELFFRAFTKNAEPLNDAHRWRIPPPPPIPPQKFYAVVWNPQMRSRYGAGYLYFNEEDAKTVSNQYGKTKTSVIKVVEVK